MDSDKPQHFDGKEGNPRLPLVDNTWERAVFLLDVLSNRIQIRWLTGMHSFASVSYGKPQCPNIKNTQHAPEDTFPAAYWVLGRWIEIWNDDTWFYTRRWAILEAQHCWFRIAPPEVWEDIIAYHCPDGMKVEVDRLISILKLKRTWFFHPNHQNDEDLLTFNWVADIIWTIDEGTLHKVFIGEDNFGSTDADIELFVPDAVWEGADFCTLIPYFGSEKL